MGRKRKAPASASASAPEKIIKKEESSDEEIEEEEEVEVEVEEEVEISQSESGSESEEEEEEEEEGEESSSDGDEESDEESRKENLRNLLEPFGKDQIINLLKEAAAKDPKLLTKIIEVADADPTCRKIFVHGLSWDATAEQLIQAFKPFGEIEDSKLVMDKITGRAKGYAFVLFKTSSAAKKALKVPQKQIGNRKVSCQLAAAGPPVVSGAAVEEGSRKMYVGNVGPHVDPEKLKDFFRRYGDIEDGPIGLDFATNKFKGFAVITYRSPEGFKKATEEPIKVFENCQLQCKKFVDKESRNNAAASQNSVAAAVTQPVNSYGSLGMNPALFGANLNVGGLLMPQNLGIGLAGNPMLAGGYNPAGLMASGLSAPIAGMGTNYGMSNMSPSVMGSYGSQAGLQGLGPYQNSQLGQSSAGTPPTTDSRAPARGGLSPSPLKSYTSYFRR